MIAYLIHCSIVWLIALLVYEIWLRRTTFHSANRGYLNASLLLGLLLPLYQPAVTRPDFVPALEAPMHQLALRQQRIEVMSQHAAGDVHITAILLAIAVAGAALQFARLIREGIVLLRWRRQAVRMNLRGCSVFVTGAPHGPFSLFGAIYLSDTGVYTDDELQFILAHEQAHLKLRHSLDKSFVLCLRCLFWWHPLVYLFYSRLCLVHEFQADEPLRHQARAYGRFLIDESMSVAGVSISHEFFYSPLKTRIRMLQRFATRNWQKTGYISALALLAAGSFLWTNKSLAHKEERNGNVVTFNGNKFEIGVPELTAVGGQKITGNLHMQVAMTAPAAGSKTGYRDSAGHTTLAASNAGIAGKSMTLRLAEVPLKMNGTRIFRTSDLGKQASLADGRNLEQALIESHMPSLANLPDGRYNVELSNIIADATGAIVYYQAGGVDWNVVIKPGAGGNSFAEDVANARKERDAHPIPEKLREQLGRELEAALETIRLQPAEKDGKPVIAYVDTRNATTAYVAEVSNGRVIAVNPYAR